MVGLHDHPGAFRTEADGEQSHADGGAAAGAKHQAIAARIQLFSQCPLRSEDRLK